MFYLKLVYIMDFFSSCSCGLLPVPVVFKGIFEIYLTGPCNISAAGVLYLSISNPGSAQAVMKYTFRNLERFISVVHNGFWWVP